MQYNDVQFVHRNAIELFSGMCDQRALHLRVKSTML